jgi:hypothetical protein
MSEHLYHCEFCLTHNFTRMGLRFHRCEKNPLPPQIAKSTAGIMGGPVTLKIMQNKQWKKMVDSQDEASKNTSAPSASLRESVNPKKK